MCRVVGDNFDSSELRAADMSNEATRRLPLPSSRGAAGKAKALAMFLLSAKTAALTGSGGIRRSHRARKSTSLFSTVARPELDDYKVNLLTLPLPELETLVKSWDYPAFRARQINNWIFKQGVSDVDDMTDLPKNLRALLKERATVGSLHLEVEQISKDGTKKRAYKLHDGQMIESVLMPYTDGRRTACISSQAGW